MTNAIKGRLNLALPAGGVGGGAGRNYSSSAQSNNQQILTIEAVTVGNGEVALISWVRTSAFTSEDDEYNLAFPSDGPLRIHLVSGNPYPWNHWREIAGGDTDTGIGQGWLVSGGQPSVYEFVLLASGVLSVDVDPGEIMYSGDT